jgi:RND superfamily putative drug exporter
VPAVLTLLGRRAWAVPRWLDRITPRVDIEGESLDRPPPAERPELVRV